MIGRSILTGGIQAFGAPPAPVLHPQLVVPARHRDRVADARHRVGTVVAEHRPAVVWASKPSPSTKTPYEMRDLVVDWRDRLPQGASLKRCTVQVTVRDTGALATWAMLFGKPTIAGTRTTARIQAGTAGTDYVVTVKVDLSDRQRRETDLALAVRAAP